MGNCWGAIWETGSLWCLGVTAVLSQSFLYFDPIQPFGTKGKQIKTSKYPTWKLFERLGTFYKDRHEMSTNLCRLLAALSICRSAETQHRKQAT